VELRSWRPRGGRGSLRVELRSCRRGADRGAAGTDGWALVRTEEETAAVRATMGRPNLIGVWAAPKKQPKTPVLLYYCIVLQNLSTILASTGYMERLISFGAVAELISFKWWLNCAVAELVVSFNSRRHKNFCWTPACTTCGGRTRAMAEQVKGRTSQWQTTIAYLISSREELKCEPRTYE
jgi:hypothetical protein